MSIELIMVCGVAAPAVETVVARLLTSTGPGPRDRGTVVVAHDLRDVAAGLVRRRMRRGRRDQTSVLTLTHGCLSCSLREDLLPLLRTLARALGVARVVLALDPVVEPEQICWALRHVRLDGAPVGEAFDLRGVITVVDAGSWFTDATGATLPGERGLAALPGDSRTVAQIVTGQAEFADLLLYTGTAESWLLARTDAVLARLAPRARRHRLAEADPDLLLLRELPTGARRGRIDGPHAALLSGQPPLHRDCGVELVVFTDRRPFHPQRLHDAIDVLLDGVVRTRGRLWLATRPAAALWIESAGGSVQLGPAGDWLAARDGATWAGADPERVAMAALHWHHRWGDRIQELAVLTHTTDPDTIIAALTGALLTDAELAEGDTAWRHYPDPFGIAHTDPCARAVGSLDVGPVGGRGNRRGDMR